MRQSSHDTALLFNSNKELVGINLGYDFCAEHEWGVKVLRSSLGICNDDIMTSDKVGVDRYKINAFNSQLAIFKKGKIEKKDLEAFYFDARRKDKKLDKNTYLKSLDNDGAIFIYDNDFRWDERHKDKNFKELVKNNWVATYALSNKDSNLREIKWEDRPEINVSCAWDESSFAILVRGKENVKHLENLYNAFVNLDVATGIQLSNNPFSRGGLRFVIVSKLDEESKKNQLNADLEYKRLHIAAAPHLKIFEKNRDELKKAGWYACSPQFWKDEAENETLKFWLNPLEQRKFDFGWYTPEEILEWTLTGEGKPLQSKIKKDQEKLKSKPE